MMDSEINKKAEEMQVLEQQVQNILAQKQSVQIEMNEIKNAREEIKKSGEEIYKVLSGIMIRSNKKKIEKDLEDREKVVKLQIDSFEKQERLVEKKIGEFRKEINEAVSKNKQ
jgi:prefoldin beta subunit